jgi:hypothetical protein
VICQQCKCEFRGKKRRIFCGTKCKKDSSRKKIDLTKLAEMSEIGSKSTYMAAVFGVSTPTITRALQTHGLHGRWQERRNA